MSMFHFAPFTAPHYFAGDVPVEDDRFHSRRPQLHRRPKRCECRDVVRSSARMFEDVKRCLIYREHPRRPEIVSLQGVVHVTCTGTNGPILYDSHNNPVFGQRRRVSYAPKSYGNA